MIATLNAAVDVVEQHLARAHAADDTALDVDGIARSLGTTEHHLRRMFSSLAGMTLSEYVRRRRMAFAAADLVGSDDDLLTIAVRHGYSSTEAFARAFRAVHGRTPREVRRDGGPLRTQPRIRFHLTVEGSTSMDVRIVDLPALTLVGHAARVPLVFDGVNPHIAEHTASIPLEETIRLKALGDAEPHGVLAVCDDLDPVETVEGAEITYLHGVSVSPAVEVGDLDAVAADAGTWAVFRTEGPHPQTLQETWAATATTWFPSQPWRLRPGPEIVAMQAYDAEALTAVCELWLPVEASSVPPPAP